MSIEHKVCSVCGREQPLDLYRTYPHSGKPWPYCKECESIEIRRKYLQRKRTDGVASGQELTELEDIYKLYKIHEEAGRRVLGKCKPRQHQVSNLVADMLRRQKERD